TAPAWRSSSRPTGSPGSRPTIRSSRSSAWSPRAPRARTPPGSGAERLAVEPVHDGELLHRLSAEAPDLPLGAPEGDQRGDRPGVGDAEQLAHLVLLSTDRRGHHPAVPGVAGGEEDVVAERVDRAAADDALTVEPVVEHG